MSFYTRIKDFLAGTSAKGSDVRAEFDSVAASFDAMESSLVRSIQMPVGEGSQVLTASPVSRAGKVLGFDVNGNVTVTTGVPADNALTVGGYAPSVTAVANKIPVYNGSAKLPASITGDAATVGGYGITQTTTALKVPVRDATGKLPGDITGNAATATNVPYTGLTGPVPTWNQNTTGNAATATTAIKVGVLIPKVMDIGAWDMVADSSVSVPHGLDATKIRKVEVSVQDDASSGRSPIDYTDNTYTSPSGGSSWNNTDVILTRTATGAYATASFNNDSINRGWLIIWYVS